MGEQSGANISWSVVHHLLNGEAIGESVTALTNCRAPKREKEVFLSLWDRMGECCLWFSNIVMKREGA